MGSLCRKPKAPPPPDYAAQAKAQGEANLQAGLQTASISNPNIISPYGNQTVTWDMSNPNMPTPTITQTLTPEAQAALNSQQRVQREFADLAGQGIGNARQILGTSFNYQGPGIQTSFDQGPGVNYGPKMGEYGMAQGVDLSQFGQNQGIDERVYGQAGGINADQYGLARREMDLSNIAAMPVNAGMTGQQAIMQRLAPQMQRQREGLRTQLINQGFRPGTEAFNRAMEQQGQQENDMFTQAALQGIGLDMSANQQGFGQAATSLGLYNQGVAQNFGQGLSAQQLKNASIAQNLQGGLAAQQMRNDALNANIANAMQAQAMRNAASAQQFNQNLQGAQFANTASEQDLARALQLRNQPINEINALMEGSQIQNPQFQGYTGAGVNAAPIYQAAQDQGNYAMGLYGQQMAARNANMSALGNIAGSAMGMFSFTSDIRLKSNIERVGTHPLGIGVYEYDIDGHRERGVMAQEVLNVKPEAVLMGDDGFYMVNYGAL